MVGVHLFVDIENISSEKFENDKILEIMKQGCILANCKILDFTDHKFSNGGYTALILLAESHASIHTYPEYSSVHIDVFACGENAKVGNFYDIVLDYFSPCNIIQKQIITR